jgi:hypothetical protein
MLLHQTAQKIKVRNKHRIDFETGVKVSGYF